MCQFSPSDVFVGVSRDTHVEISDVFKCFGLDATRYIGKDACTETATCVTVMSTELGENGIQSMNL